MEEKELKSKEKLKNKKSTKDYSNLISKHQPLISDHKGITLIALVITIIVMLILVGVTITLTFNNGLFSQAKEATKKTQLEVDRESLLSVVLGCIGSEAEVNFDELDDNLPKGFVKGEDGGYTSKSGNTFYVDEYGNITTEKKGGGSNQGGTEPGGGGSTSSEKWELAENGNTATSGEATVNIGDYVNYTPTSSTYSLDKLDADYTGSTSNTSDLTTQTELKWRILGVDKNGCLTIISDKPTSNAVYFQGAKGYNNGVYILNDICKTLYSRTDWGVNARSLTIEDVEGGFSPDAETARNSYINTNSNTKYNQPFTYRDRTANYPVIYAQENGSGIGVDDANQDEGRKTNGIGVSEPYYDEEDLVDKNDGIESDSAEYLTCTQTYYYLSSPACKSRNFYDMIFSSDASYYLASRGVCFISDWACFGLRVVDKDNLDGCHMFTSDTDAICHSYYLRPVVSLGPDITLTTCSDANSADNPHKLSKASS